MMKGSFRYKALKAAIVVAFGVLMWAGLWLVALPVRVAAEHWGWMGAWAVVPFILVLTWFADKWLDKPRR